MRALEPFEGAFSRRLRQELDALDIRTPPRRQAGARARPRYFWIARPLAVAVIVTIALAGLATAVTASPDPSRWIQPAAWQRAFGIAPTSPSPTPRTEPSESPEPSSSAEPGESPEPQAPSSPRAEPSEHPESPESSQSPEPRESEAPGG
jgi:outer membrane biosynthesis protein TonB